MSNGRSFGAVVIAVQGCVVPEGFRAKMLTKGSGLLFQGVNLRALLVKSSGGGTDAFLGSGD